MSKQLIYDGKILALHILDNKWEVVDHAEAVVVIALNNQKVLGVKQHRPAIDQVTWELPAGLIDEGEDASEAALRELSEETGLTGDLEFITQVYSSPGFTNEKIHLFSATNLSTKAAKADEDETIEISWQDIHKLWQEVKAGSLATSAPSLLGISYAANKLGINLE